MNIEHLQYPIGKFEYNSTLSKEELDVKLNDIKEFPTLLREKISHLSDDELEKTYKPDGWTIRQIVHHCADSHMNAFIRFKWTLTEDNPMIKAYDENAWAKLRDYSEPVEVSIKLLAALHRRWVLLIENLSADDLEKYFIHPAHPERKYTLAKAVSAYSWHGRHHLAHIDLALG